jgi:23S rRNA (uracil1939-C5)-methyltransferase
MVYGGSGMGRIDNIIYFCPFVLPGEVVNIKSLTKKKHYIEALPNLTIEASKKRITPRCPYFTKCGGCDYQHIDYYEQIHIKKDILMETFSHIGKIKVDNVEVFSSSQQYYYRNRIQLKVRNKRIGFYAKQTNKIVPINSCQIAHKKINEIITYLENISLLFTDTSMDIYLLASRNNNCVMKIILLDPTKSFDVIEKTFINFFKDVVTGLVFYIKEKIGLKEISFYGYKYISERVHNMNFNINIDSFFQINIDQLENMLNIITDYIKSQDIQKAADLYCGVGTFSITISKFLKKVIAIENNSFAINDAIANAHINNCNNIVFINKNVEESLNILDEEKCDLIIIDPPRSGLNKGVIRSVSDSAQAIVYIACDPSKQARDIRLFINNGFILKNVMFLDMFPQTYHIESICILEKKYAKEK